MYTVLLAPRAEKDLSRLPRDIQSRLWERLDALAHTPRPHGVKKLQGRGNLYRVREGAYRIIYTIRDLKLIVLVVDIGHQREVYRGR
jgi:mRNA interferase RelE/StbE